MAIRNPPNLVITKLVEAAKDLALLKELDVANLQASSNEPTVACEQQAFPSLITLSAKGQVSAIFELLQSVTSSALINLQLTIQGRSRHPPKSPDISRFTHSVRTLHLQVHVLSEIPWTVIVPFLDLEELQVFCLRYYFDGWLLDNPSLLQMINSWPSLRSLTLLTDEILITLQGLGYIASHCRNLRYLETSFNARDVELPEPRESPNALKRAKFRRPNYRYGDEDKIFKNFLRRWWPRAKIVMSLSESMDARVWESLGATTQSSNSEEEETESSLEGEDGM